MKVAQSSPTLCNLMNYIIHGILHARILEWVAFPFSRGSSNPGVVPASLMFPILAGEFFATGATWETLWCHQFGLVQLLSHVRLFATSWTAARQASLSITNSQSSLKLLSIESVLPSNHLILCRSFLLPPSIFPSLRVFSNESANPHQVAKVLEFQLQHQSFQ